MAYTVNKSNSSASPNLYTVQDGVINTQIDLSFIGKGYAGYGETIAENFLHLLENFSNTAAPTKPIVGQLWYDSTNARLGLGAINDTAATSLFSILNDDDDLQLASGTILSHKGTILHGNQSQQEDKRPKIKIYYTEPED